MRDQQKTRPQLIAELTALRQQVADLEASECERTQEFEALVHIANILVQPKTFEDKCSEVLEKLVEIVQANWVTFRVPGEDGLRRSTWAGLGIDSPPVPVVPYDSMPGTAFRQKKLIVANDYRPTPWPPRSL